MIIWGQNATGSASGAYTDAWDQNTVRTLPTTAVKLGVSSGDAKDTATGPGAGALTVRVGYLDANYALQYETITMAGQTEVDTTGTALRVVSAEVLTVGSELDNAGVIYIYDSSDTVTAGVPQTATKIFGRISAGDNVMRAGMFTVPANKTYRILKMEVYQQDASATLRYGKVRVQYRLYGGVWQTVNMASFTSDHADVCDFSSIPNSAPTFAAKTDLRIQTTQLAATPWGCQLVIEEW